MYVGTMRCTMDKPISMTCASSLNNSSSGRATTIKIKLSTNVAPALIARQMLMLFFMRS